MNFQQGYPLDYQQIKEQYVTVTETIPSNHPVNSDEAKLYCKVDIDDDDDIFKILIHAATSIIEAECGYLPIIKRTITQKQTGGLKEIELLRLPKLSLTSVIYNQDFDSTGVNITTSVRCPDGVLFHRDGYFDAGRNQDGYVITYTAGMIDDTVQAHLTAPPLLKSAILRMIAFMYENRQEYLSKLAESGYSAEYSIQAPPFIKAMLAPYYTGRGII